MNNGELDSGTVNSLKQQVHNLRHDLAERNALLNTVQKQLNNNKRQPNSSNVIATNESTTGRFIEHLQVEIDNLRKELNESKTQAQTAKISREKSERQVQEHTATHQTLRLEIDSLKRMLERKERQTKELEESSRDHEKKSTYMKFERDNASTKLRQAELKVSDLERKLSEALACKEKAEYEYKLLSKEMQSFKARYAKDVETVKQEFKELRQELNSTSRHLEDVVLMAGVRVEELTSERKVNVDNLESVYSKLKENQEKYTAELIKEVKEIKIDVENTSKKTDEYADQVSKMKGEITGKLNWLKRVERVQQEG
nr:8899_t:CDS:2 [Entrophospora candida]CAG8552664.1 6702_t:CDS:2 [Entrophospora candida]